VNLSCPQPGAHRCADGAANASPSAEPVSAADLRSFTEATRDLIDPQVMGAAWQ